MLLFCLGGLIELSVQMVFCVSILVITIFDPLACLTTQCPNYPVSLDICTSYQRVSVILVCISTGCGENMYGGVLSWRYT